MRESLDPHPVTPDSPGPYAALAALARRTSDGALAGLAGTGGLATLALAAWRPAWWAFALPVVSVGAFGAWGIADRERAERGGARPGLAAAEWVAIAVGTVAALVTSFAVLGVMLGTVIS